MAEFHAVIGCYGAGFGCEAEIVEDGIHKVAGAIAGEGAASAIGAVGPRCQTKDEYPGLGVAETGNRLGPVGLVDKSTSARFPDSGAVGTQARASFAGYDGLADDCKVKYGFVLAGGSGRLGS